MVNTTWSATDKSAGIALSGGNLIATNTDNSVDGGRAAHGLATGKYYFECVCTRVTYIMDGVGITKAGFPFLSIGDPTSGVAGNFVLNQGGTGIVDGGTAGLSFGSITNGTLICVAIDLTAHLGWFRVGIAGLWNMSGAANPATGTGGASIPNLGGAVAAFPAMSVGNLNDAVTANFGDSAFSGAVPSGFTAGFPTTATSVSGVQEMAFVAGPTLVLGVGAAVQLPAMVDVSGNGNSYTLYSHMRVPGGTTYTFDSGQVIVVPATTDSVFAVPTAARFITATAASTAQMGQMQ